MSVNSQGRVMRGSQLKLLFIDISDLPSHVQMILLSTAMCGLFIIGGILQEVLSRMYREEFLAYNWYLTLIQLGWFSLFGLVNMLLTVTPTRRIPLRPCAVLAILTVASFGLSNLSLSYINFPTMVLYKSMKLVPVLIGGVLFYDKKRDVNEVVSAILLTVGVVGFTLADAEVSPTFNVYGVLAMVLVICADIAIGNIQQRTLVQYRYNNSEMMFYSTSIGFLCLLVSLILTQNFQPAFSFCNEHPIETYGYTALSSMFGFLGTNVLLILMKFHGSLIAVTVTLFRKALSIFLSFLIFPKPFIHQYTWSALLFFIGFLFNIYSRHRKIIDSVMSKYFNIQ